MSDAIKRAAEAAYHAAFERAQQMNKLASEREAQGRQLIEEAKDLLSQTLYVSPADYEVLRVHYAENLERTTDVTIGGHVVRMRR